LLKQFTAWPIPFEKEKVNTFQKKTEKRKLFHWQAWTKSKDRTKKYYPVAMRLDSVRVEIFLACRRVSLLFDCGSARAEPAYLCFAFLVLFWCGGLVWQGR
jgi:hypothetical protein